MRALQKKICLARERSREEDDVDEFYLLYGRPPSRPSRPIPFVWLAADSRGAPPARRAYSSRTRRRPPPERARSALRHPALDLQVAHLAADVARLLAVRALLHAVRRRAAAVALRCFRTLAGDVADRAAVVADDARDVLDLLAAAAVASRHLTARWPTLPQMSHVFDLFGHMATECAVEPQQWHCAGSGHWPARWPTAPQLLHVLSPTRSSIRHLTAMWPVLPQMSQTASRCGQSLTAWSMPPQQWH